MTQQLKAHLAIAASNVIFGLNVPVTKTLLDKYLDGFGLSFLRIAFAMAAFWALAIFTPRERVAPRDLLLLAVASVFGITLNQLSFVQGLSYTTTIDASIVITITPVLVMCLAAVALKEPISLLKVLGVVMGAGGALIIILHNASLSLSGDNMLGNLLCFCSSLSYAIYLIISKPLVARYSPATIMRWMFLFATAMMAPMAAPHVAQVAWSGVSAGGYLLLLFTLLGATFLTYLCIGYTLRYLRPTTLSMYNYVQPLVASLVAVALGLDTLGWYKLAAAVLIFAGVYLVTKSRKRLKPYQ